MTCKRRLRKTSLKRSTSSLPFRKSWTVCPTKQSSCVLRGAGFSLVCLWRNRIAQGLSIPKVGGSNPSGQANMSQHIINKSYFETVLNIRLLPTVNKWAQMYQKEFVENNNVFAARYIADENVFDVARDPQRPKYFSRDEQKCLMPAMVVFCHYPSRNAVLPSYELSIPTKLLLDTSKPKYTVYRVSFGTSISRLINVDDTFSAFASGYIGITKRSPLQRFQEHMRDARSGNGYLFHSSWRALKKILPDVTPQFTLCYRENTIESAYDREEYLVEKHTLAPKGLNAIPGGKSGLRMMHLLREGRPIPTPGERDAILRNIADSPSKKSSHYRIGHVRNLPSGKKTWVSPCWINVGVAA